MQYGQRSEQYGPQFCPQSHSGMFVFAFIENTVLCCSFEFFVVFRGVRCRHVIKSKHIQNFLDTY